MMRKSYYCTKIEKGEFLKHPGPRRPLNPMLDPAGMEVMLEGMKRNMFNIVPQTVLMAWISYFFSGFLLSRLSVTAKVHWICPRSEQDADLLSCLM
jgi:ER membrane protein complex subunit 3